MGKQLIIAEKPSVAREFARALEQKMRSCDGYMESEEYIITWCVGHLVTMSYPEAYDDSMKRWSLDTLPFLPDEYKYEIIENVKKQFNIVKSLFHRQDVDVIYNAGDAGREGEYIQRLVLQMAGYNGRAALKRIWIDSQTQEEILRGIREAKDSSEYDNLGRAAYLRAREDYLMGINFSRVLTLKYGYGMREYLKKDRLVISVGRVMTCVLGMVVKREREIRDFVKTPFYKVFSKMELGDAAWEGEWRSREGSAYFQHPLLYKDNGFLKRETAVQLIQSLSGCDSLPEGRKLSDSWNLPEGRKLSDSRDCPIYATVTALEKKKEIKHPPLLYNLAELQNDCSRFFKLSPDETLRIAQELYEKKLITYPRTDARVLSSAVTKEIYKNIHGMTKYDLLAEYAKTVLAEKKYQTLAKTRYVNDKQITDHYAIIPTGQGQSALSGAGGMTVRVYELIARRFLSIFYAPAVYQKINIITSVFHEGNMIPAHTPVSEHFYTTYRVLTEEGYLKVAKPAGAKTDTEEKEGKEEMEESEITADRGILAALEKLKKGQKLPVTGFQIRTGETKPPKRYNSGSMILAMENAGQLIEDEELRSQIKGSGIGTSATRAEILKKLVANQYLILNKKTQILTPAQMGEMIYEVVEHSIRPLLNPELTASWEKGLTMVAKGEITSEEYMQKLNDFVGRRTNAVKSQRSGESMLSRYDYVSQFYGKKRQGGK